MPRQQRIKSNSGYYHIMLRGNERRNIFLDDDDKLRFIETIYQKKQENKFYLHAFCLMDNHIHLLINEGTEDIAKVIKRIAVSYVFYFNKKYKREGHLFQDRFRSEIVEDNAYVLALIRYIHQNPVKANIVKYPGNYQWSSYNEYLEENKYKYSVLDKEMILSLFSNDSNKSKRLYVEYMNEDCEDSYLDLEENNKIMDEEEVRQLYEKLLKQRGINLENSTKQQIPDDLILELKK